jgi:hypothetical protein
MIDKFKPKLPRLPYPFIPRFDPPAEQPPYIPPESSGGDDEGSSSEDYVWLGRRRRITLAERCSVG